MTGRRDGSSRFSSGNKFGNFGAVGAAWIFSEELDWSWLSFGKVRGSYGITGNDQIKDYQYLQNYLINDFSYEGNVGLIPARLYNPNYQWEENVKKEVALELEFLNGDLGTSIAYYNNRSSNQLIDYALPGTTGFPSIQSNLDALVENSGIEVEVNSTLYDKEHFTWNASLNLSFPKNELMAFPGLENSTYANQYVIGEPISVLKLYRVTGVNKETGIFEFQDYNGDGMITSTEDREFITDVSPKILGGFSNSFQYKRWSADVFLQYMNKKGYNEFYTGQPPGTMFNQPVAVLDRWQEIGDAAPMQQFTSGANDAAYTAYSQFGQSSGVISDASFIRLKSMALSYSLPLNEDKNRVCRVSVLGQNLLTFTNFKGGDPEQIPGFLPPLRRIVLQVALQL